MGITFILITPEPLLGHLSSSESPRFESVFQPQRHLWLEGEAVCLMVAFLVDQQMTWFWLLGVEENHRISVLSSKRGLFSSVTQSCPTLCGSMDCSMPGLPVHHWLPELAQTLVHWVRDTMQPSHPLLSPSLLPSIFPSIRVFSNESVLRIRWPKYWSFRFNISLSNEYSGLIWSVFPSAKSRWL